MRMRSIAVQTSHYVPWSVFVCSSPATTAAPIQAPGTMPSSVSDGRIRARATWQCDPRAAAMRLYVK